MLHFLASLFDLICHALEIAHGILKFASKVSRGVAEVTHDISDLPSDLGELARTKDDQGDHQNHPKLHWPHAEEIQFKLSVQLGSAMRCSVDAARSIPFGPVLTSRRSVIFDCAQVFCRGWMRVRDCNILIDARLLAYRRGGIARYVESLLACLPRVAPDLDIVPVVNRPTDVGTTTLRVITPPHFRFERLTLGFELSARRPRLVHSPDFIASRVMGAKQVVTVHDLNFVNHPEQLTPDSVRYYRQLYRSLRSVDRIIAVSNYTAGQLANLLEVDRGRIAVIPNGVDTRDSVDTHQTRTAMLELALGRSTAESIAVDRPIILMVGTIEPRKRHLLMLRAMEFMASDTAESGAILIIAGQPGWKCDEIVREIEAATIHGSVIWLRDASDRQLAALYRASTLVVVPSFDEGFGLPALEAMAAGTPVIAANRGALPEVVGDAALLSDSEDAEGWSRAMTSLINDRERRGDMTERGLIRARQFSWEQTATMTADLYREVLES